MLKLIKLRLLRECDVVLLLYTHNNEKTNRFRVEFIKIFYLILMLS